MTITAIPPVPAAGERPAQRVRVLVADHDGFARRMMQNALQEADGVMAVPAARDAHEALQHARYYRPTVLLLDSALPPTGCVELIGEVLAVAPQTRIVTVSADQDETVLAALRAGAVGHISKDIDPDDLVRLVALAADGEAIVPRQLIPLLLGLLREVPDTWRPVRSCLTPREWEIIELLAQENSTERIADRLVVSPTTVYSHVKSVLRKLGVHSRSEAVTAAQRLRREEALGRKPPISLR
jgi:DNA-binding NarL/FixJ family response regulator